LGGRQPSCEILQAYNMNAVWFKFLPDFVRRRLHGRPILQTALGNMGWMLADRSMRLGVGLIVGVWIARYLGPQRFGLLSYAVAFSALFGAFATLGLDGIVIRELAKYPERKNVLLGSAFVLKLLGGSIALLLAVLCISIIRRGEPLTIWLVSIAAAGYVFQSVNGIDMFFQSKVQSRYSVFALNGAFICITVLKIVLLMRSAPLICFAWAALGEIALGMALLLVAYRVDHNQIRSWRYDPQTARELLRNSWPLIFATIALLIQARIDQVMLGDMISNEEVGQYSAAMRLIEVFSFVPMIIVSTLSPHVAKAKATSEALYHKRLLEVYRAMTVTFFLVAIPIFFFGERIVLLVFGSEYKGAAFLLSLFAVRLFFANESLFRYSLMTSIIGAAVNIAGNYILIPRFRSEGAIVSTIISFSVTTFAMDIFYARTRVNLRLMIYAVFKPFDFRSNRET
jgi:O-antigen/teichoic acid export membrane protein